VTTHPTQHHTSQIGRRPRHSREQRLSSMSAHTEENVRQKLVERVPAERVVSLSLMFCCKFRCKPSPSHMPISDCCFVCVCCCCCCVCLFVFRSHGDFVAFSLCGRAALSSCLAVVVAVLILHARSLGVLLASYAHTYSLSLSLELSRALLTNSLQFSLQLALLRRAHHSLFFFFSRTLSLSLGVYALYPLGGRR
jgi:hypothetical protein